jgi:hypothetical protein
LGIAGVRRVDGRDIWGCFGGGNISERFFMMEKEERWRTYVAFIIDMRPVTGKRKKKKKS